MTLTRGADATASVWVARPPEQVWLAVSDPIRYPEWSPENIGAAWRGELRGPIVGARFRGTNRRGPVRWATTCTVVEVVPERVFAFEVSGAGLPVSRWAYRLASEAAGTRVTEEWTDRRRGPGGVVLRVGGGLALRVRDRGAHNRAGMEQTLAALKAALEHPVPPPS